METAGGDLEVELFALMMMGDDRAVRADLCRRDAAQGLRMPGADICDERHSA